MEIYQIKSFTKNPEEGNPAGVISGCDDLNDQEMLEIARDLGFSESAFVFPSQKANAKVRFFSPEKEVDLCFHALLAVAKVMNEKSDISQMNFETKAGIVSVEIAKDGLITIKKQEMEFLESDFDKEEITKLLRISKEDFLDFPIELVSIGVPKLMIPVRSSEILQKIEPDFEGIKSFCEKSKVRGFYPFTLETRDSTSDFQARQFNPLAGIPEDPITGVAAGALGIYVVRHGMLEKNKFIVEQGFSLGKLGKIFVEVLDDSVKVGGYAVEF